jgi:ferredoxin
LSACGLLVCTSSEEHKQDFQTVKAAIGQSGALPSAFSPTICSESEEVRRFVGMSHISSLVIAGLCDSDSLEAVRSSAIGAGVSKLAIQTVDFGVYRREADGVMGPTWAASVLAHLEKARAASFVARAKTMLASGDTRIARRSLFFSLPKVMFEPVEDPVMVAERCVPFHRACRYCSEVCEYSAIAHWSSTAQIDSQKCVRCGACAAICPSGALQPPAFSDDEYLALLRSFASPSEDPSRRLLLLTCDEGIGRLRSEAASGKGLPPGVTVTRVPCAAALGWHHFIWAVSSNVAVLSVCPTGKCSRSLEVKHVEEAARAVALSLAAPDATLARHITLVSNQAISDIVQGSLPAVVRRTDRSNVPRGSRLEATRQCSTIRFEVRPVRSPSLHTFDAQVSEKCTVCGICSNVCPVKAFTLPSEGDELVLKFRPALCTGCRVCESDCPERAINVIREFVPTYLSPDTVLVKFKGEIERCRSCGKVIGSKSSLRKLHDTLARGGTPQLAETVYICQECKTSSLQGL